ncbi:hypothetical protein [Pantoea anthophila]|nr:hypothetical protein [Pantoea anthophila]WIM54380.1 hypothetical protein P7T05_18050 [Pantoea anthophila]
MQPVQAAIPVGRYGHSDARFVVSEGDKGDAIATRKYDAKSKQG